MGKTRGKLKQLISLLLCGIVILTLASCTAKVDDATDNSNTGEGSETTNDGKYKVAFCISDYNNDYFITLVEGIKAVQDEFNIEVIVADGKSDAATQVTDFENFITQGVDAIICAPYDSQAVDGVAKQAKEAGIPVAAWATDMPERDGFLTLKQHDYGYTAGQIAGQWIVDNLDDSKNAQVLLLTDLTDRGEGIIDGVHELAPDAVIVDQLTGNTADEGIKAAENVLTRNPDLNVVVSICDASALGAYEAMSSAGKKPGEACVVGCDAVEDALAKIRDDTIYVGTVDVGTFNQGRKFCELAKLIIEEGPQDEPIYVDFIPVTKANIGDYPE
jgi:ABC-type sugar transport system substrate-binding protein